MRQGTGWIVWLLVCGCLRPSPSPSLTGLSPDRGPADRDVAVTISGTSLGPLLVTDFSRRGGSVLDASFSARLGREALRDVVLNDDGTVSAVVPQGITPGIYELVLTPPGGSPLTLPGAYRVLAANEVDDLVASFRFDAVAPAQVGVPFAVTVTAVDQVGLQVDGFAGTVALTDLTGSVVPKQIGPFSRGVWNGLVEVRALHGSDVLTATSTAGRTGSSNPFPVGAGSTTRLVFATPPRSATAGACSDALTVQAVDALFTPSPAPGALPLTLTALPANGFQLFSDAACAVPLVMAELAAGQSALTFHFRGTRAGAVQLTARSAGLVGATQIETVTAGSPSSLVFTTPDPTLNSGACSSDVTVQVRDAFDNPAPVAMPAMVALDVAPAGSLELFASGGCATPATSVLLAPGSSTGDFQLRGAAAGAFTVTASSPGLSTAMLRVRVNPAGFPTQLVIVSMPQTVPVGICSGPLAVQSQDASGNAVTTPGQLPVSLSASPAMGFQLFDDPGCSNPVTMTTLGVSTSTSIVYFRGTRAGAVTVTAASTGLQSGVQTENLTAGPASRLVFTSAPQTVRAGACSGALDVGLLDALGNPATAPAAMTVTLAATPGAGVTFFADAACATAASTFDLAAGAAAGRLYFIGTVATMETFEATSPGFTTAQQLETVTPGAPVRVVFASLPQTVGVNACSSAATVEVRDAFGNASPVMAATPMTLTASPAAGFGFFSDPTCGTPVTGLPIAAMASTASFFFRASALGPVMLTASPMGLLPASQTETVVAGPAAKLQFTTPPRSAAAAQCSAAVTVTAQDASDNPSPGAAPRMVSLAAGTLQLFSDPTCATAAPGLTIPAGQSAGTLYFRSNTAAAYAVTASSTGLTDGVQTQTVTPAAADRLAFVTPPRTSSAGACSAAVTFARRDPFGNDAPGSAATVMLTAAPSAAFTFYSDAGCTLATAQVTLGNGATQETVYFVGTVAAGVMLTVSSAGLTAATQGATVTAAAAPTQLVFTTPARTVTAGGCSGQLTVQARDSFNNPRAVAMNTPVALAGAGAIFYSDAMCMSAVGQVSISGGTDSVSFYFRANAAGALPVSATAAGLNQANQTQTVTAAAPDRLVFTTGVQSLQAGACSAPAAVQSRDAFGNPAAPAAGQTVTLTSGAGVTFFTDPTCTAAAASVTLSAGATTASFYFRGTAAGMRTLSAAVAGWTAATQGATFTAAAPTQVVFTNPARTIAAGACSAVLTVETRDAFGNPAPVAAATNVALAAMPAAGFSFHSDATCTLAAGTPQIPAGASAVSLYARGTAVGAVTVTATAAGLMPASQPVTVIAGAPAAIVFTTPARTAAAGACSEQLDVQLRDAFGNPAPSGAGGLQLSLSAMPAVGFAFHDTSGCAMAGVTASVAAGMSQASFFFRGTSSGAVSVTVSSAGLASAVQGQTVTPGAATAFSWDPVPSPRALNTAFGVTVRARDAFGNLATGYAGTAVLAITPSGSVGCTSSCTNATTTDVFSGGVWSGTVTITGLTAVGQSRALVATQGALSGTSNPFTVTGPALRSPPTARFTFSPAVIDVGGTVTFNASASSDFQTPTALLQVSFDPQDTGTFSPYTTTKTFAHRYDTAGLFRVSLLVRDTDGDVDYRSGWVRVLNPADRRCVVNTASDVDDGASSCSGSSGPDGRLSLAEAVRLSNTTPGRDTIMFSGPMTITGSGVYDVSSDVDLFAPAGVILVGKTIDVSANGAQVSVYGLEMSGQTSPFQVTGNTALLTLTDVYFHDMPGVVDSRGTVVLEQVRMANCTGACLTKTSTNPGLLTVRYSELRDSPTRPAISIIGCPPGNLLDIYATTLTNFAFGVQVTCAGTVRVASNTFEAVGTGVALTAGASNVLVNNIFTNSLTSAASCGSATFSTRSHHHLFNNASNGCLTGDPSTLTSDPQYAFASAGDVRLGFGSPAINTALDTGYDLTLGFPGNFIGAAPDRGGRESY